MIRLSDKTLKVLSSMINEETRYRSGPQLVDFFNALGFSRGCKGQSLLIQ